MTGKELFEKYSARDFTGSEADEYAQLLLTIFFHIGDELYPLLEKAESENKKLSIPDSGDVLIDTVLASDIILV